MGLCVFADLAEQTNSAEKSQSTRQEEEEQLFDLLTHVQTDRHVLAGHNVIIIKIKMAVKLLKCIPCLEKRE